MKLFHTTIRFLSLLLLIAIGGNTYAGNTDIGKAMALYKSMKINDAATHLIRQIQDINSLNSIEKLKFALIIKRNLLIYRDIYKKSIATQQIFLESLSLDKNDNESQYAAIFLAEVYILQGRFSDAIKQIEKFEKNETELSKIANIYRLWIEEANKGGDKSNIIQSKMNLADPLVAMAIDAINISTTNISSIDLSIIKSAEKEYMSDDNMLKNRFANYAIRIYSHQGKLNEATNILLQLDQKTASYTEEITPFKLIHFYEPSLIESISHYYYHLAKYALGELEKDKKYHDMAVYYLSDLDLITANKKTAEKFEEEMLNVKRLPKSLSALRDIRKNGHSFLIGKVTRAHHAWEKAVNNAKNNPAVGAEAVLMCLYLDASCPKIVQTASVKAENGRSKRFESLNMNIGRYFLLKKENNKAIRLLENALDRGKADGLLMNDPILLLNLAESYRLEKKFSESLQVYFSIGKNFPILRQIQDAVQGEYLFRQRSNGNNSIF